MAERQTQLHWFPRDPEKHLARTAHLSPEAYAAFDRLRAHAWLASSRGEPACTLTTDDEELCLMSGIGRAWGKVRDRVLAMFTLDGGRHLDVELYETWKRQQAGYERRASAGGRGGKAKALRKQSGSNATTLVKQQELEPEGEQTAGANAPGGLRSPAPAGALSLVGDARPGAGSVAADVREQEQQRLEGQYFAWLRVAVDEWCLLHGDSAKEIELEVMRELGVPFSKRANPTDELRRVIRDQMLERVRVLINLPDSAEWIARGAA